MELDSPVNPVLDTDDVDPDGPVGVPEGMEDGDEEEEEEEEEEKEYVDEDEGEGDIEGVTPGGVNPPTTK